MRGPVTEALLDTADALDASMLVVGTRGLGPLSGLLLGSISRRLLFTTHRPLVVVPRESTLSPSALSRVLVGVDCSTVAERVLSWSATFCASLGVPATIVRCADPGCEKPPGHVARDRRLGQSRSGRSSWHRSAILAWNTALSSPTAIPAWRSSRPRQDDEADLIVIGRQGEGQFRGTRWHRLLPRPPLADTACGHCRLVRRDRSMRSPIGDANPVEAPQSALSAPEPNPRRLLPRSGELRCESGTTNGQPVGSRMETTQDNTIPFHVLDGRRMSPCVGHFTSWACNSRGDSPPCRGRSQ